MRAALGIAWMSVAFAGECLQPSGARITAGDLARALPEFAAAPAASAVAYAPLAGIRRVLSAAEVERAARLLGVTLERPADVCFAWALAPLSRERVTSALREAAGDAAAAVEVMEWMRSPAPAGRLTFTAPPRATDTLWHGSIEYGGASPFRVWVRARVRSRQRCVVAVNALPARQPIRREDLRIEERLQAAACGGASLDEVAGRLPALDIAAGAVIAPEQLRAPQDVRRGEVVTLRAAGPDAIISTEATAEVSGRRGEVITVRNLSSGRRLRARIEGSGLVTLVTHAPPQGESR